jgi:biopolymer transport protein ExbB/TolQ
MLLETGMGLLFAAITSGVAYRVFRQRRRPQLRRAPLPIRSRAAQHRRVRR